MHVEKIKAVMILKKIAKMVLGVGLCLFSKFLAIKVNANGAKKTFEVDPCEC